MPRAFVGNIVAMIAAQRAVIRYVGMLRGAAPRSDKTGHLFPNGNPAITIGNTIYIKQRVYRELGGSKLPATPEGVEMLLHEYTHVLQYGRLGFARFGARYAAEFKAAGGEANKMYDYKHRNKGFNVESLEGQAALVGDFGQQLALPTSRRTPALIQQLRSKLNGTGILGQ